MHESEDVVLGGRGLGDRNGFSLATGAYEALHRADALVIVTEWQEFRSPDFDRIKAELSEPVIFDGRNLYSPEFVKKLGVQYYSVGRGAARP